MANLNSFQKASAHTRPRGKLDIGLDQAVQDPFGITAQARSSTIHLILKIMLICFLCLVGCSVPTSGIQPTGRQANPTLTLSPSTESPPALAPTPIVITTKKDPATPITVTMILSIAPKLNEPADLSLIIQSILDAPGTKAEFILPEGTQVDSGDTTWTGDLKANQPVTMSATIHFTQPGNLTIQGKALESQPNGDAWGDMATLYLNVTEKAGKVGFSNP